MLPVSASLIRMNVGSQEAALKRLAEVTRRAVLTPIVKTTALQIIQGCASRDDNCELQAIFDAVKMGSPLAPALVHGFKYVADTPLSDVFTSPRVLLESCLAGACGDDCDGHGSLIAALTSAVGFAAFLEAWGPGPVGTPFVHVYGGVAYPKRAPHSEKVVMDTSVEKSVLGWRPPGGHTMTVWL